MSRRIEWIGPMLLPTGYGQASREHARAVKFAGGDIIARVNAIPHPSLEPELIRNDHLVNQLMDPEFWPKDFKPDVTVVHTTPDSAQRAPDRPTLNYSVWEVEGLPRGWSESVNRMDGLLTASRFSARLFREGGVTVPIGVAPHPIDMERFHPLVGGGGLRAGMEQAGVKTLFLVVAQWMFRKGVEDALVAYFSEFRPDEPVGMALLVWRWGHRWSETQAVRGAVDRIRAGLNLGSYPRVWYLPDKVPPEALPTVYGAADVLVNPSRGEAFSLPIFEMAATGKPSIATGYGGQWDWLTDESAYRVPFTTETLHGAGPRWPHYGGWQKWAQPSIDGLRRAMREAHEDPEGRKRRGQAAFEIVADNFTYTLAGKATLDAIDLVLDTAQAKV